MNNDPHSPFQVRNDPFLIDSLLFASKVLLSMGLQVDDYAEIHQMNRWDEQTLQKWPEKYFSLLQNCHWAWADGAQNDSHAGLGLGTARSFTAALRKRIPA